MKKALVTGITGQDGSYLAELLLAKGYEVHGLIRRSSSFNTARLDGIYQDPHASGRRLVLHYGDLNDASSLNSVLRRVQPDEIYNLGAQSHVKVSFDVPDYTGEVTALGAVRILEAVREAGLRPRFYQASSSEMFGQVAETPQRETTPFHPRSPYGVAKVYAYWMWRMLQADTPDDYVVATGETHTVREFCDKAFGFAGITLAWEGEGVDEIGRCTKTGKVLVRVDPRYFRPAEVDLLLGDPAKAKNLLGWEPTVTFEGLVEMMTRADLDLAASESGPRTRD